MNWNAERESEWIAEVNVAPGQRGRMDHAALGRIDHAWDGHTHAFTSVVIGQYLLDATGELLNEHVNVAVGLKTADDAELPAHQIGDKYVGARRTNIDTDNAALARVDVKERRAATASD